MHLITNVRTRKNRRLAKTECFFLIFASVFLSSGFCQNVEPRGSFRSAEILQEKTQLQESIYEPEPLHQRFDSDRWGGSRDTAKNLNDDVNAAVPSVLENRNSNAKTEAPGETAVDDKDTPMSQFENRHEESTRKTSLTAGPSRCNSGRGSKRRLCSNESRYKKRRRYTNFGRGLTTADWDFSPSNRIRGSSGRSRRVQERGQVKSKNRGRKRTGKRTRKPESKTSRSRKNETAETKISPEASAAFPGATSERIRGTRKQTSKGFMAKETLSNETIERDEEKMTKNGSAVTRANEESSDVMKNVKVDDTMSPDVTSKQNEMKELPRENGNNEYPRTLDDPEMIRRRHEENVEHELSKNLEKEILWSRTEFPYISDDSSEVLGGKTNSTSSLLKPEVAKPSYSDSFDAMKNSRYDASKMLGYARSAEDLPIVDLENEVLARTFEDYKAYLKNGGKASKLMRHSPDRDTSSADNSQADVSRLIPRPVYRHQVIEENGDQRKLQQQRQLHQLKLSEQLANTESSATLKGDLTCINGTFIPAPLARHALIKYVKSSIPGHEYLEADYECIPGFYMASSNSRLLCKNRRWIGALPNCKIRRGQSGPCAESSCDHVCNEVDGQAKCSCYKGFRLDGHKCYDVNECENENGGCEYNCVNTPGSYRCECPQGMKRGEDKFTCIDVNECLLNNGHRPCQDTCHNHEGSYTCSCEGLTGTVLASDNHTCLDAGACSINNAGCSHTCLSTMGRVFCLCPDGFMLIDDWKTCQDVDECYVPDLQTEICHYGCINTPGSYRCVDPTELSDQPIEDSVSITCFPGYELTTGSNCVDINECAIDNGGCSEVCENTEGSYFCACDGDEKALSADGKSCTDINNLACAPLDPARRGFLMCSRETTPRMWSDARREANRPGTKCYLKCPVGYQLHGEYELTCQGDGTWDGPKHGECVKYSKPTLECPKDVVAEIPPDRDEAFVTFDQPSTDLDWFRYVRSKPSWGTRLEASLKPGLHLVTFFARHPVSKKQASCVLRIIVKEGEAPKVNNCPSDIVGQNGTLFTWTEPTFTDNVRVTHTSNNESPGKSFGIGEWKIVYEASDEAGWTTRCVFSVVVHQD